MDKRTIDFILENDGADVTKLLLGASRYPGVDLKSAAQCIKARSKIKTKIPSWYSFPELEYPSSLPLEQCSSEASALYKQRFVLPEDQIADLTGGLGADSFFLSKKCAEVDYFERNSSLVLSAKKNFKALHRDNINVIEANINSSFIDNKDFKHYNLIYLDPARRGKTGEKIYSVKDCEPNILEIKEALLRKTGQILVKISPMADISATIALLPETVQVHIISVEDECKEVLLLLKRHKDAASVEEPKIFAVNISKENIVREFTFFPSDEYNCGCRYADPSSAGESFLFLFEPNRSILKSGAFKLVAERYNIEKVAPSTHLYIGQSPIDDFPGKVWKIKEVLDFNKQTIKNISKSYPRACVSSKNFPIASKELQIRLKISDGGNCHIFACALENGAKKLIVTY